VKDLGIHLLLFLPVAVAIVVMGTLYAEPDDAKAFGSLPRRFAWFVGGCAVVGAVLLAVEHLFASVS